MTDFRLWGGARLVLAVALVAAMLTLVSPPAPATAATPAPNPPIAKACGIDITLVLDASGSVQSSNAVEDVRNAASAFLEALQDTGSTARVLQFGSIAAQLAPRAVVTTTSNAPNGAFGKAVAGYYNPKPPRPSNVEIKRYNGGSITNAGSFSSANSSTQYTNWAQVLHLTEQDPGDLVVFVTDGDPTAYDFDRPNDPFDHGPPADVAVGTDLTSEAAASTLDRAVRSANLIKDLGARMLAVGVGAALQNPASVDRLIQVSGPNVADSAGEFDLETTDVALIADFANLEPAIRALVLELCSPSLTIRKFAQSASDATYQPVPDWDITVTPSVPGGTFDWILPAGASGPQWTVATNADGFAQFQWEPTPGDADSTAEVEETLRQGFLAGRPDDDDYVCQARDADGNVRTITGELDQGGANPAFTLDPIGAEIVTCSLYNSFDYQPQIALTKVNAPTEVRGDLQPPATVVSTYTVTNPGNTPLSDITGFDDQCGLVDPVTGAGGKNVGDTNGDGLLDPGESWTFTCDRQAQTSTGPPGGINVVNNATVQGSDPTGTVVTDSASDDVDIFNPAVELTKLVDGVKEVTVASGTEVTYTYAVRNAGNTPLGSVSLVDDQTPCGTPTRGPDAPGNDDDTLDVGETWTYACTAAPIEPVVNTAVVSGTPLNPLDGDQPFAGRNPDVTSTDTAAVATVEPGLTLTKEVDQALVFPGTEVTYTYGAENTGTSDLRNDTGDPGWVTDNRCADVNPVPATGFNAGDVNQDGLLNPGETWQFTCSTTIDSLTLNVATIVAQPVANGQPISDPLTRRATALVRVVTPAISLTKTALVGVVLDPDANPISGPDVPDPRPAQYLYQVTNTGTVPIRTVILADNRCADPTYVDGDTDSDDVLDVDEVWNYTCATTLERQQATPPPGDESGLVTNTATVTGTPFLPDDPGSIGPEVTDQDIAQVLVIEPSLQITKTASAPVVQADSSVTYTFAVTNTGDVGLQVIGPQDDKCPDLTYVSGDNGNGLLEGANSGSPETWIYTCTRQVAMPTAPDTEDVNTASVEGLDPLGNLYESTDSAVVRVIDPAIDLVKTVSETLVPAGTRVSYGFDVTNVGRSPVPADDILADITLTDTSDPAVPACNNPRLVSKTGGNQDDILDRVPPEVWHYACGARIDKTTTDVAVVTGVGGTQFGLSLPVTDSDAARVQVFHPAIEVEKSANPTRVPSGGGEVTYTYRVRNTGDVPLSGVADRISDDTCAPVRYVSGDSDHDGLLDTPTSIFEDSRNETWVFRCTTTVTKDTVNVVTVTGTPSGPEGESLCGPDSLDSPKATAGTGSAGAARALPPCDVRDQARAVVKMSGEGPNTGPPGGGPNGNLPDTGSQVPWQLLLLAIGLTLLGIGLVHHERRSLSGVPTRIPHEPRRR